MDAFFKKLGLGTIEMAMMDERECKQCKRMLAKSYTEDICPTCLEINLFSEVREFIRNHDVNEFDVAEKFQIPRSKVKGWIKEGRIEYKEGTGMTQLKDVYCVECGKPIISGRMCADCLRKSHLKDNAYLGDWDPEARGEMRYANRNNK